MNGAQDLGGMQGFGPVAPQPDEPPFHADWERRALAVTLAAGALGHWSIDEGRHARESLHPAEYLSSSYFEIWLKGLAALLARHGLASPAELAAARALEPALPTRRPKLAADAVASALARGAPYAREASAPARFTEGEAVRTVNAHPTGHTRLPRYARGRAGVVERVQGVFVLPDAQAHGLGEQPCWLYTVRFEGRELWGADADAALSVSIDAFEPYLEQGSPERAAS